MTVPSVAVVIAVDRPIRDPDARVRSLGTQGRQGDEVILVDPRGAQHYGTAIDAASPTESGIAMRYVRIVAHGRAACLNYAISLSAADIVLFLGDDFEPQGDIVTAHRRFHIEHPEATAVGVGAGFLPPELRSRFSGWLEESGRLFGVPFLRTMTSVPENFFFVANSSVKRVLVDAAGAMSERFPYHGWEDYEFGVRLRKAGMVAQFVPDAIATHDHHIRIRDRCRVMREAGESVLILDELHPGEHPRDHALDFAPWFHRAGAVAALGRYLVRRQPADLANFYGRTLNASFSAGYRSALRRRQAEPVRTATWS